MTQTLGQSVKAFMLWIFNTVDTELARRIQGQEKKTEVRSQKSEDGDLRGFNTEARRHEGGTGGA